MILFQDYFNDSLFKTKSVFFTVIRIGHRKNYIKVLPAKIPKSLLLNIDKGQLNVYRLSANFLIKTDMSTSDCADAQAGLHLYWVYVML